MDQVALSSDVVLEILLKTNRPPTIQERATIQESMAPTNAKLKVIKAQISDTMAHIQELKSQVEQAEIKLQRLHAEEAAVLETFADHRRVFSPFRNLPEDVLREICLACVEGKIPSLSYRRTSLPFVLAQISSGMRRIALTTSLIWASMSVEIRPLLCYRPGDYKLAFSALARRTSTWFERAGRLALTISIEDSSYTYAYFEKYESDPSKIFFDTLLSYSTRWKEIHFNSRGDVASPPMIRIAALTGVDVPLLQSVSLRLDCSPHPELQDNTLLTIPTLRHVNLETYAVRMFTVNWTLLTSITLRAASTLSYDYCYSKSEMARILQKTKCLVFCDIVIASNRSGEHYSASQINLPLLKTLIVSESIGNIASSEPPSTLNLITAPILEILIIHEAVFDLAAFFKRSPHVRELSLPYFNQDKSLMDMMGFLHHCPSLAVLSLRSCAAWDADTCDANGFLRAFVEERDSGVICPRLQFFNFTGKIDFSLETLRLFLKGKQGDVSMLNLLQWKKVGIDFSGIKGEETYQQMLDVISQKQAAGLDVEATHPVFY